MVRNNNMIPNGHFHKNWQIRTKTWFSQPMKKLRRHNVRVKKQRKMAPRPVQPLRPIVQCPTVRYNTKIRAGRGFTLRELKKAGINKKFARTIGICVDHRRRNRSLESLARNLDRLKRYRSGLILYPKKSQETVEVLNGGKALNKIKQTSTCLKVSCVTEEDRKFEAFVTLRKARSEAKMLGRRLKRKMAKSTDLLEGGK